MKKGVKINVGFGLHKLQFKSCGENRLSWPNTEFITHNTTRKKY